MNHFQLCPRISRNNSLIYLTLLTKKPLGESVRKKETIKIKHLYFVNICCKNILQSVIYFNNGNATRKELYPFKWDNRDNFFVERVTEKR
jgi:hypothetical protein